jgi:hypothetical protein
MIFCNSGERVKYVFNVLSDLKIKATYVTSDLLSKKVLLRRYEMTLCAYTMELETSEFY